MFAFFGDSHSRQFHSSLPGNWLNAVFSGATIKGLVSPASATGHGEAVREIANAPFDKRVFLMFGAVDMDVTFYRKLAHGEHVDEAEFFEKRSDSYAQYIERLLWLGRKRIASVHVLAPQLTPLQDQAFARATAVMAKVDVETIERLAHVIDCSHLERCRRQKRFNDQLARSLASSGAGFRRIDDQMADADGLIRPEFAPRAILDHHASPQRTLPLWYLTLQDVVPPFARTIRRRNAAASQKAADRRGATGTVSNPPR